MSNKFKNKMIMNKKSKNEENNNMYRSTNTKLPFADSNKLVINIGTLIVYYQSSSCEQKKGSSLDTQEDCIYGHFKPKRRNSIKPNRKKKSTKDFNKRREMKWITENNNNNNSTYSYFKKSLISFFVSKIANAIIQHYSPWITEIAEKIKHLFFNLI